MLIIHQLSTAMYGIKFEELKEELFQNSEQDMKRLYKSHEIRRRGLVSFFPESPCYTDTQK